MNTTKIIVDFPGCVAEKSEKLPINISRLFYTGLATEPNLKDIP